MAEAKTKPTTVAVGSYIASVSDASRRTDCETLAKLMAKASKQPAVMWGSSIVGFGVHEYASGGKLAQTCAVGFSSRKGDISIYGVVGEDADAALLSKLGKHKTGKSCLYVARLADVDLAILEQLVAQAARRMQS